MSADLAIESDRKWYFRRALGNNCTKHYADQGSEHFKRRSARKSIVQIFTPYFCRYPSLLRACSLACGSASPARFPFPVWCKAATVSITHAWRFVTGGIYSKYFTIYQLDLQGDCLSCRASGSYFASVHYALISPQSAWSKRRTNIRKEILD